MTNGAEIYDYKNNRAIYSNTTKLKPLYPNYGTIAVKIKCLYHYQLTTKNT